MVDTSIAGYDESELVEELYRRGLTLFKISNMYHRIKIKKQGGN